MPDDLFSLAPGDKLARLIKHSAHLLEKQEEIRKVLRETVARMVEEKLRAQNGGSLNLREYEHMLRTALRKAQLAPSTNAGMPVRDASGENSELFNALVEKLLQEAEEDAS